jgi:hypothetical protein
MPNSRDSVTESETPAIVPVRYREIDFTIDRILAEGLAGFNTSYSCLLEAKSGNSLPASENGRSAARVEF